ncbi:BTB domain-containing protein [Mycena sanguinolenta]|uniref:BTB domain-containing protein n=1 Tax=Mycena sanguinolenta TaxID=230812 RepID=A0A8H6Y2N5_9AGAR|nr:BTB domain-containing protein [Mycena sanguinolenta]
MSSPPVKRQRTEDVSITRSTVWYRDGSVILQATNIQFRVHWGVLSQHSSFFRALEDFPQPSDQPTIDGSPIVELPDSAADIEHLLTALYDPTFLSQTTLALAVVGALIRLGRKYDFKNLLDSAVARLTSHNPATLAEYDALNVKSGSMRIMTYPGYSLDLLTLAQENNIGLVLPLAYYRTLRCSTPTEWVKQSHFCHWRISVDASMAAKKLATKQFQPGYTLGWLREWPYPPADCDSPKKCNATRKHVFYSFLDANRLKPFLEASQIEIWKGFLCVACYQHVFESVTAGRQKMWEELPAIFDLPPWHEVKNDL